MKCRIEYRIDIDDETLVVHTLSELMGKVDEYGDEVARFCDEDLENFTKWLMDVGAADGQRQHHEEYIKLARKNGVKCLISCLMAAKTSSAELVREKMDNETENNLKEVAPIDDLPCGLKIVMLGDPDYGMPCFKL